MRPLPPALDLSAFRIVQEALTNALKHAGPARAEVTVRYKDGLVSLEIRDSGRGPDGGRGTGHGLVGMRERVAMFGGKLEAARGDGGGFAVRAQLPVPHPGIGMIRVLLADDQALVRGGFRLILDTEPDMEVVAEAADGDQALAGALETRPDVVLMDIRMPVLDGIEATRRLVPQLGGTAGGDTDHVRPGRLRRGRIPGRCFGFPAQDRPARAAHRGDRYRPRGRRAARARAAPAG